MSTITQETIEFYTEEYQDRFYDLRFDDTEEVPLLRMRYKKNKEGYAVVEVENNFWRNGPGRPLLEPKKKKNTVKTFRMSEEEEESIQHLLKNGESVSQFAKRLIKEALEKQPA